ncbi:MAG: alpha/beta fold hydrolase [Myxococcales bacterium]|nr:alpha/beta fold hydrolase [Myxococcales bacterium]
MTLELPTTRIELPCGSMRVVDVGDGSPVLLLHGAPMTSLAFVRVIRRLRESHRVIAPDLPGFGGSTRAPGFAGDLAAHADAVRQLVRALDLHDLTVYLNDSSTCIGLVALEPEAHRLRGVVVADTVPLPMTGLARPVRSVLWWLSTPPVRWINRTLGLLPWLVVTIAPLLRPFSRAERRALLADWRRPEQYDYLLDVFSGMARDQAFLDRAAAASRALADLPALLLFGQLDPMRWLGGPRRWAEVFPRSESMIVPLEEHFPILASGDAVGAAVAAWVQRVGRRSAA